jgi:protein-S-isoprenylcysteine O-methyltransferase Ste14
MNSDTPQSPLTPSHTAHESPKDHFSPISLGAKLFQWRDFTPIPLILVLLIVSEPTAFSATLGLCSMIFGELIRIYGVAFIGSVSRTRNTQTTGNDLITGGPFAIVRNPLYVGNLFLASGIAIYSGHLWFVMLTLAAFAFQYYCIVKYEESLLLERFGDVYARYMEKVPAWFPSQIPSIEKLEWPTSFSIALKSERKTFAAIVIMIALMLTKTN